MTQQPKIQMTQQPPTEPARSQGLQLASQLAVSQSTQPLKDSKVEPPSVTAVPAGEQQQRLQSPIFAAVQVVEEGAEKQEQESKVMPSQLSISGGNGVGEARE